MSSSSSNPFGTLTNLLTGDLGAVVVAGAAGKAAEDITASDVMLVTLLIDASSSIASRGLEDAVREGQNLLLDALGDARERDSILLALWVFSDRQSVVHAYVGIDDAVRLDRRNYVASGGTRLYDTWCDALLANVAYAEKLRESGTPCRSLVVVVTDGEDCGSQRRVSACADLSRAVLGTEQFTLAFVGVGSDVDFHAVAKQMGVPDGNVAVQAKATPAAIRKVFQMVSQSAIRASQGLIVPGVRGGFFGP
jgi:uncharacterized protein YegL